MADKCKVGEDHVKFLKDHTDNVALNNEAETFENFSLGDKLSAFYIKIRKGLLALPDPRKDGEGFIRDQIKQTMKGNEAKRAQIIVKLIAILNTNKLAREKLKDYYLNLLIKHSKEAHIGLTESMRWIGPNKNIRLHNLPLSALKLLYAHTIDFVNAPNMALNPFSRVKKNFIQVYIGKQVLNIGTPTRNRYRDISGALIVMYEGTRGYVGEVSKMITKYLQKDIYVEKGREWGFDDIYREVKMLKYAGIAPHKASLTLVRLFNMFNMGRAFIKDGQFFVYTDHTRVMDENGIFQYYKSGDVKMDWSKPILATEYWAEHFPQESVGDIVWTPKTLNKFKKLSEKAQILYEEMFNDFQKAASKQYKELFRELARYFPPGLDTKTLTKIIFTDEGIELLDPKHRKTIQFLKDNFIQYGIFEPIMLQGALPDPPKKKRRQRADQVVNVFPFIYPQYGIMLEWQQKLDDMREKYHDETDPDKKAVLERKMKYFKMRFSQFVGANVDSQTGNKIVPHSTAVHMKQITNEFSPTKARTDESIMYEALKSNATTLARNGLMITLLRAWRIADGNTLVQEEIQELWKVTMHDASIKAEGATGIQYGAQDVSNLLSRGILGRFKYNVSAHRIDQSFRTLSNWFTGWKLSGALTPVKNSTAHVMKIIAFGMRDTRDAEEAYNENPEFWDRLIAESGVLSYGDFFSKGLVSNLSGDHELDRRETWKIIQTMFKYYKEVRMAEKKQGGMTKAKAKGNLERRLKGEVIKMPGVIAQIKGRLKRAEKRGASENELRELKKEIKFRAVMEMTAKLANRAITLEYVNTKHVDSIPDALIWGALDMIEFETDFKKYTVGMPTMGGTEGTLRSIGFIIGVLKLQQLGHLRGDITELKGQQLSDAIRFGAVTAEAIDFMLSQQGIGRASRGPIGSALNKFKFWPQQKFGWDVNIAKQAYRSLKSTEHIVGNSIDKKAMLKMLKLIIKQDKGSSLKKLQAENPSVAAWIRWSRIIGPITLTLDMFFTLRHPLKWIKKILPGFRDSATMYKLGTGLSSDLVSLALSWPIIIGLSFWNGDDEDDWADYLSGIMHNTYVGVGGMLIQDMLVWLWYLASIQREERIEQSDKIIDTLGFWPGSRMRIYKAWAKKASTVMEAE